MKANTLGLCEDSNLQVAFNRRLTSVQNVVHYRPKLTFRPVGFK